MHSSSIKTICWRNEDNVSCTAPKLVSEYRNYFWSQRKSLRYQVNDLLLLTKTRNVWRQVKLQYLPVYCVFDIVFLFVYLCVCVSPTDLWMFQHITQGGVITTEQLMIDTCSCWYTRVVWQIWGCCYISILCLTNKIIFNIYAPLVDYYKISV